MQDRIREVLERERENILSVYRDLHAIPELSAQEFRTSAYIADYLEKRGFQVQRGVGGTGLVSYLRGEDPGPVLGVRADMDALGHLVNGEIQAIHSCGHDAHSTMGIFTAVSIQ